MKPLSRAAINRLPRYFSCLRSLINSGVLRISSEELAPLVGMSAAQVRGDLCALGGLGQQGYGYSVKTLYAEVASRLGAGDNPGAVIFGTTPLGIAAATGTFLSRRGVRAVALLYTGETDGGATGANGGATGANGGATGASLPTGCELRHVSELDNIPCRDIAILACDDTEVPEFYRLIADSGFRGLWNLTEIELRSTAALSVVNARIGDSLMTLCYGLHSREKL